jgi:hypothetical protein
LILESQRLGDDLGCEFGREPHIIGFAFFPDDNNKFVALARVAATLALSRSD